MNYKTKIIEVINAAHATLDELTTQEQKLNEEFRTERISGVVYRERNGELCRQRDAARLEAIAAIGKVQADHAAAVTRWNRVDGSMLHDDAKLLELPMQLEPEQFSAIVEKHKNNPLMVKLMKQYADKNEGVYADFLPAAETRLSEFGDFCNIARTAATDPSSFHAALLADGKGIPDSCGIEYES